MKRTRTKRVHYITNAVGTQDHTFDTYAEAKEYALTKRTLLSKAADKYQVIASMVKKLIKGKDNVDRRKR
jgi:hypothetical protein|tara:strand:+ start:119 stop:328 length:210 start_codon:yes stop_codon:yes gene_type:complete